MMNIQEQVARCLAQAVENHECAGISVLVRRDGQDALYASAGYADRESSSPVRRDSIFRLYSQSKPVTAAAAMLLVERGVIDLMDPVEKYLPGFRGQKVWTVQGLVPAVRPVQILDLLGMTAGLCYPDADAPGQAVARVFEENQKAIAQGGGMTTAELCNRLGQCPLAFQPGAHFRYSTCADVLGGVIEAADGRPFAQFLEEELFKPLGMKDTAFYAKDASRLVTCYKRVPGDLEPFHGLHLCVGDYSREPAFASGGAGLVSTLDDYAAFAEMLMNGGSYHGRQILTPSSVRYMTQPQLGPGPQANFWDSLSGFSYGKLMRICVEPGRYAGFASLGEYGWDGWLGSYFANLPAEGLTILSMQNTTDTGTCAAVRKVRNLLLAADSLGRL